MHSSRNCPRCHRPIPSGIRFCPACGYSLAKRRRIAIALTALICVALAAGAAVLLAQRRHAPAKPAKRAPKAAAAETPLDPASLTPEETASLITVYAAERHGGDWQTVLTAAKTKRLQIILYDAGHFQLANNGEGTAYDVRAGGRATGTVYTLNGRQIHLYRDADTGRARLIETASLSKMAATLARKNKNGAVTELAPAVSIVNRRTAKASNAVSGTAGTYRVSADTALRTWYTAIAVNNGGSLDGIMSFSFDEVSGEKILPGDTGVAITYPPNTYYISAIPLAAGAVCFQQTGPNTVRIYQVPSHFQDARWYDDDAWARARLQSILAHPITMTLRSPDAATMAAMRNRLGH